jgi:hypothetical protein
MAPRLHELRLNARELLRQPGLRKAVEVSLPASDLGVDDERITGEIVVDLVATSNIDGIVVEGTVTMPWRASCRRCLAEVVGTADIHIDEVYQDASDVDERGGAVNVVVTMRSRSRATRSISCPRSERRCCSSCPTTCCAGRTAPASARCVASIATRVRANATRAFATNVGPPSTTSASTTTEPSSFWSGRCRSRSGRSQTRTRRWGIRNPANPPIAWRSRVVQCARHADLNSI